MGAEMPVWLMRTPGAEPEMRYIDFVYLPLIEVGGTRSGVLAHGQDVTEHVLWRHEAERLLAESEHARTQSELSNRAKVQFLTTMSHELRTPLTAIGGYTELLQMGLRGALTPSQLEFLNGIKQSQNDLLGLITQVLDYAKLDTGFVHYKIEDVAIRSVLSEAELLVAPQAHARGLELVFSDFPPSFTARADAEKVRQIIINLISNSIKFTDNGRIWISVSRDQDNVNINVSDTGIGIPAVYAQTHCHRALNEAVSLRVAPNSRAGIVR